MMPPLWTNLNQRRVSQSGYQLECRKTKVTTIANHKGQREPIKTRSKHMHLTQSGERRVNKFRLVLIFQLDEKVARVFKGQRVVH